jgi:hypothetical protein
MIIVVKIIMLIGLSVVVVAVILFLLETLLKIWRIND